MSGQNAGKGKNPFKSALDKVLEMNEMIPDDIINAMGNTIGYSPLLAACKLGRVDDVRAFLRYEDVNSVDEKGYTPLFVACMFGKREVAEFLLRAGANPETKTVSDSITPLFYCCMFGHVDLVELLIFHGAELEATGRDGWTPLMVACQNNRLDVIKCLLGHGAQVNRGSNRTMQTPLSVACMRNQSAVVVLLIKNGADVNRVAEDYRTPFLIACAVGSTLVVRMLLRCGDHAAEMQHGLSLCCDEGHVDTAKVLVENGAKITPIEFAVACKAGKVHVLKYLFSECPDQDVNQRFGRKGRSLLFYGTYKNHLPVVKFLLGVPGIAVNQQNSGLGTTALITACLLNGGEEIVKLLLERGADVNTAAFDGHVALMNACFANNVGVIRLLLRHGADPNIVTARGNTVLTAACYVANLDIVKLLVEHGANVKDNSALSTACNTDSYDAVNFLLEKGADLSMIDDFDPLVSACRNGQEKLVRILLKHGATMSPTKQGSTPREAAKNFPRIVRILKEHAKKQARKLK